MPPKTKTKTAKAQYHDMKFELEDLAQQLSKTFKDAGRLRIRYGRRPDLVAIQEKVEKAVESKAVLGSAPPLLLASLKEVTQVLRAAVVESRDPTGGLPPPPGECWCILEAHLLAPYENLAGLMRAENMHVPQVRNFKLVRSLYHASSSLAVVCCAELAWTSGDMVLVATACCGGAWAMEFAKSQSDGFKRVMFKVLGAISRDGEQHNVNSATWLLSSLFLLSLCFGKLPSCMGALALGVGDPAAALVGSKLGHIRLYGKKTLEGSVAFAAVSFTFFVGYMQLLYTAPWPAVLRISAVGAACGSVAELYCPVPTVDDNLFVPVVTAACVTAFLWWCGDGMGIPGGHVEYSEKFDWLSLSTALPFPLPFELHQRLPPADPGVFKGTPLEPLYALVPNAPRWAL